VIGGASALADPTRHFAQLYNGALSLDDPLQAFFFRATWINVIAWGLGYILAGRHRAARGPVLIAGGAGKLAYFGACLALFLSGSGSAMLLAAGIVDVIFAGFFVYVLWLQRTGQPAVGE
jgi:ABC-type Mn2+/Zn2+ transport system permease subunit